MSADLLRRAAELMRDRLNGATSGPWLVVPAGDGSSRSHIVSAYLATRSASSPVVAVVSAPQHGDTDEAEWGQTTDAEHIAHWDPQTVDLLGVLLDELADDLDCGDEHDGFDSSVYTAAVDFAAAYLGESR